MLKGEAVTGRLPSFLGGRRSSTPGLPAAAGLRLGSRVGPFIGATADDVVAALHVVNGSGANVAFTGMLAREAGVGAVAGPTVSETVGKAQGGQALKQSVVRGNIRHVRAGGDIGSVGNNSLAEFLNKGMLSGLVGLVGFIEANAIVTGQVGKVVGKATSSGSTAQFPGSMGEVTLEPGPILLGTGEKTPSADSVREDTRVLKDGGGDPDHVAIADGFMTEGKTLDGFLAGP